MDLLESMRDARDVLRPNGDVGRALGSLTSELDDIDSDAQTVADEIVDSTEQRQTAAAGLCEVIAQTLPPQQQRLEQIRREPGRLRLR